MSKGPDSYYMADLFGELQLADSPPQRSLASYLPGLGLVLVASLAALWLSEHYGPPAVLMGLLIGFALSFTNSDRRLQPGLDFASQTLLRIGIVLIGLRITFGEIAGLGFVPFATLLGIMAVVIAAGLLAARLLRQDMMFGLLAGGATAICGASAALALWSIIGEKRISSEQFTIVLLGTTIASATAMTFYPAIASLLGLTDTQAGFLIGASIHDVAQAIGGGFAYSEGAGEVATVVKLSRVAMLVPVLVLVSIALGRSRDTNSGARSLSFSQALPWFIVGFVMLVALGSLVALPPAVTAAASDAARLLLLFAVTAAAIKSNLAGLLAHNMRSFGPVIVTTLTAFVAALAAAHLL
ncbi:YeiH family protein [Erythrobacter litoralis]|uniref:Membrane protein, putative n=1 Tax=Erythrobacter litoralis (strain HTCC2594) TaxID=314225 RepID=Q2N8A9_ERYLH|nr:putative sulfate exporter family transporter [Erythrobacter litoralis]ABC64082.1 membrane protein, putative [Erythrobacter litoralis HTCC2594]